MKNKDLNQEGPLTLREWKQALESSRDWMVPDGCDCGTDEPGTCGLCLVENILSRLTDETLEHNEKREELVRAVMFATEENCESNSDGTRGNLYVAMDNLKKFDIPSEREQGKQ